MASTEVGARGAAASSLSSVLNLVNCGGGVQGASSKVKKTMITREHLLHNDSQFWESLNVFEKSLDFK